jgi:hypothetical protein
MLQCIDEDKGDREMSSDRIEVVKQPLIESKPDLDSGLLDHAMNLLKDPRIFDLNKSSAGELHPNAAVGEIITCAQIVPSERPELAPVSMCSAKIPDHQTNPSENITACSAMITDGGRNIASADPFIENCRKPGPWTATPDLDFHTEKRVGGIIT